MTNAHVVHRATSVLVRAQTGTPRKWLAIVCAVRFFWGGHPHVGDNGRGATAAAAARPTPVHARSLLLAARAPSLGGAAFHHNSVWCARRRGVGAGSFRGGS